MLAAAAGELLAQGVPVNTIFVSPIKLILMAVCFLCWVLYAQWLDNDARRVNTYRIIWNLIGLVIGLVGAVVIVLVPNFWIGMPIFLAAMLGLVFSYTLHRNKLVRDEDKILTAAHISEVLSGGKKKKEKAVQVKVKLRDYDGKRIGVPDDSEEREQFRLTQELLFDILWQRAQIVQIIPGKEASEVRLQVDGLARKRDPMPREEADAILVYLKTLAGLDLDEHRKPQQDKIQAQMGEDKLEIEVRTDGSTAGEKLTLRVFGDERFFKVENLGFTQPQLEQLNDLSNHENGLIMITGPQASGLTTTLYSFARTHDAFLNNIQTLEYRVELPIDNITQTQYVQSTERPFSADLQKLFRSDPDVLLIPEIRDQASAVITADGATKKTLVYTVLQASSIFSGIKKWIELVGDPRKAAKALSAVTNQRLVRKLCPSCREAYKPDPTTLKKLNLPGDTVLYRQGKPELDKRGNPIPCQHCQGVGYIGRIGVFDLLVLDDALRNVIASGKSIEEIQSQAAKQGGLGLQKHAITKVLEGKCSIQEITRVLRGG
jgi:type II secretory ATPase GspE/PulE/Tfp pilus assembly ATPase PilB-like protein